MSVIARGVRRTVGLLVLGKSNEEVSKFACWNLFPSVDELRLVANPGRRFGGLASIGNAFVSSSHCDIVGIVHADTTFEPGSIAEFALQAGLGRVSGMVGCDQKGVYRWCSQQEPGTFSRVSTLDSCSVFFERVPELRFDDVTFDSFHCAVEDLCLLAQSLGREVVVPYAIASHLGGGTDNPAWIEEFKTYKRKLLDKWAGTEFKTT